MPKKKLPIERPIDSTRPNASPLGSVASRLSVSRIQERNDQLDVEIERLQKKLAKLHDNRRNEPSVAESLRPNDETDDSALLEEPLSGAGHESILFPWHPFPLDMSARTVKRWTALYSAVRSNGPGDITDRHDAVSAFVLSTIRDAIDSLQLDHERTEYGDREFRSCVRAMSCAMTAARRFDTRLIPAFDRGDFEDAILIALEVGFLLCKSVILQSEHIAAAAVRSQIGREQGEATKSSNAEKRRIETQKAVREIWKRNPKQSLSAIQHTLASQDSTRFGKLRTIQKNTVGMKYER